jgi:phage shock protein E
MQLFSSKTLILLITLIISSASWAGEAAWIDVRSADEYAGGHVSNAVNIPYTEIVSRIGEVTEDKDALIYVYCRSGRRSGIAKESLEGAGFSNVVNLGGLKDAQKAAAESTPQ